jgi:lipopolysaccharide export system protein LptA
MSHYLKFLLFTLIVLTAAPVYGQKKVRLKQADTFRGGTRDGESFQKFIGNVIFTQKQTTIYCDSALLFRNRDVVEAFGHVKILEGDSTIITSRRLIYNGDEELARLRQNVVFEKVNEMTLYTDNLDYDIEREMASYFDGGRLIDSANVLTSDRGTFNDRTDMATFRKNVVATFPEFTLRSEALDYNTRTKIVYFIAPTTLINEDGTVVTYTEGQYDTRNKSTRVSHGQIESADYTIKGDRLQRNEVEQTSRAIGNVILEAKEDDVVITGAEATMNKKTGVSKVYGKPLMKKPFDGDTLYLSADTLVSIDSENENEKRILAYHNVKIFKKDLQGVADSLVYFPADSIIRFFKNPILWTSENQMTADTISVFIANNTIDRMEMDINSFVIAKDTIENFNQIKGRKMISYFQNGNLDKVNVNGNSESIFFALDENEEYVVGMNKIICSRMIISFKNNQAKEVSSLIKPDASFTPPHELKEEDLKLRGFNWQIDKRPTLNDLIQAQAPQGSL